MNKFHVIIPAGGAGTRLWPLSRVDHPKFLLDLTGTGRTLIQQTVDRLAPISQSVTVVTGLAHRDAVRAQLPELDSEQIIAEPSARDSAAAICLAAAVLEHRHPGAIVGSFAADHAVRDVPAFQAAVGEAVVAAQAGNLVTIGIAPSEPSTAFGYIRPDASLGLPQAPSAMRVAEFVEKPDLDTAARYVAAGYRWNAGMFVAPAALMMELLAQHRPALHEGLAALAKSWDTDERENTLARVWPTLEKVAIDYAIAEPAAMAGRVAVVPADIGWTDVGDFDALYLMAQPHPDQDGLTVLGDAGQVWARDANGLVVAATGRRISVLGLDDIVVVDTPDALLITTRSRAQEVKDAVAAVKDAGRNDLL